MSCTSKEYLPISESTEHPKEWNYARKVAAFITLSLTIAGAVVLSKTPNNKEHGGGGGLFLSSSSEISAAAAETTTIDDIKIVVHRDGYSHVEDDTRALYGFDHIAEPYVENIIEITNPHDGYFYDWSIQHLEGPSANTFSPKSKIKGSPIFKVTFQDATDLFQLNVKEYDQNGINTRSFSTVNFITKFVKREIRTIKDEDREKYLSAMEIVYSVDDVTGKKLYGDDFLSHSQLAALHNTDTYRFHANTFFLTSHPAITLKLERSLLSIDKTIILTYFDFLNDAKLGGDWVKSDVYKEDWFGTVENGRADDFRITGRFRDVKVVYDPDSSAFPGAFHNAYGFLTTGMGHSSYIQRTDSVCGFKHKQGFASCALVERCLDDYLDGTFGGLFEFDDCLENNVHGTLHGMHGGMWNCPIDFQDFFEDHSDFIETGLMSFVAMEAVICTDLLKDILYECPSDCSVSTDDDCFCSTIVADSWEEIGHWSHDKTYKYIETCLSAAWEHDFRGKTYLEKIEGKYYWKGKTQKQNTIISKLMLQTAAISPPWGVFNSGAATSDPLFFVLHQVFDRILHLIRTSPIYKDLNFYWYPQTDSHGEGWFSETPFNSQLFEPYLGAHFVNTETKDTTALINNKELWEFLKPDTVTLPYVYDELKYFGECILDAY
jgi:hypothetical protein